MSTRGAIVFKYKDQQISIYNKYDSYISGLGFKLIDWFYEKKLSINKIKALFNKIIIDDSKKGKLSKKHKFELFNYDPKLFITGRQAINNYENLINYLYEQIDCDIEIAVFSPTPIIISCNEFLKDRLFCEYIYTIDINNKSFSADSSFKERAYTTFFDKFKTKKNIKLIKEEMLKKLNEE
jgi:hypothetical protein